MISGALANDHYRAARSVPLVRRTAGNGAILPLVHKPAKDGCPLPLRSLLSNGCLEGSCFTLPPGTQRPSHYGGKALGRVTFTAVGRMMSVVCDGRKELPAGASREYSSYCGNYTFDGEKLVTRVDAASDLSRNGGDQVRGCASKARTWSSFPRHGEPAGSRNTARSPGNASRRSKAAHSLTYCEIRARNG